jgi:DNA-binding HxlR family transcriptional regulator
VIDEGKKVVREELEHFLKGRNREVYLRVLKVASFGARWAEIRRALGFNIKRLSDILKTLTASMLVEKRGRAYVVPDPILRRTLQS